ncbi:hypothetical protein ACGFIW_29935 [Micromonospora sp. NPDC048935]|uniref:hypothetical protein n=1 Tax=Micromonospora sp. NPDC048935 TaxID=3364262 RepID=UPI0037130804
MPDLKLYERFVAHHNSMIDEAVAGDGAMAGDGVVAGGGAAGQRRAARHGFRLGWGFG